MQDSKNRPFPRGARPAERRDFSLVVAFSVLLAGSCAPETDDEDGCTPQLEPGPLMRPGQNCLGCHQDGFGGEAGEGAPEFTAAGTIFASPESNLCDGVAGVTVVLTGASGEELRLVTNAAGNFWTSAPLTVEGPGPRLEFEGRTVQMASSLPPLAACNACHALPPIAGAPGRIFAP